MKPCSEASRETFKPGRDARKDGSGSNKQATGHSYEDAPHADSGAKSGGGDRTIMDTAGHVSPQMLARDSPIPPRNRRSPSPCPSSNPYSETHARPKRGRAFLFLSCYS